MKVPGVDLVSFLFSSDRGTHKIRIEDPQTFYNITPADLLDVLARVAGDDPTETRAVLCTKTWEEWERFLGAPRPDLLQAVENIQFSTEISSARWF